MSSRTLTAIALLVVFTGAGLAVALMFPGHMSESRGASAAIFAALITALVAPIVVRANRRSRAGDR